MSTSDSNNTGKEKACLDMSAWQSDRKLKNLHLVISSSLRVHTGLKAGYVAFLNRNPPEWKTR
jgi:hypothetical protein